METMLLFAVLSGAVLLSVFRHRCLSSIQLALLAVITVPINLFAQESGKCGDDATWSYNASTKTLRIDGSGSVYFSIEDWALPSSVLEVEKVEIGKGMKEIICGENTDYSFFSHVKECVFECDDVTIGCGRPGMPSWTMEWVRPFWYFSDKVIFRGSVSIGGRSFANSNVDSVIGACCMGKVGYSSFEASDIRFVQFDTMCGFSYRHAIGSAYEPPCVGEAAFRNCHNLQKFLATTVLNDDNSQLGAEESSFKGCESLVEIPVLNYFVGDSAFYGCENLKKIVLSEGEYPGSSVGYQAFGKCENLDTVYVWTANGIESWLDSYHIDIERENWYEGTPQYWADRFYVDGKLIDTLVVTLQRSIAEGVFYGYKGLKKLIVDAPEREYADEYLIGASAFGSDSLAVVELNLGFLSQVHEDNFKGVKQVVLGDAVESIHSRAGAKGSLFRNNISLETINIPPLVESIPANAFSGCKSLKSVDISEESILRTIGNNAFAGDSALVSIGHLPYTLEGLGDGAFQSCAKLRGDIVIPDGVSRIGENTFDGCLMLTGMSLPAAITEIGDEAFKNCVNLKEMSVYTLDPPTVGRDAFENLNCTLKVPCMGAAIYKIADGWDYFEDNIVEISPYRLIVVSNNDVYGSVQVTTPATCESDIVTVSAVPAPQCHFVCWRNRAGDNLSEANPYVFTITSDLTLIAEFRSDADTAVLYTVDYEPNPAGGRISVECEGETVNPGDRLESGSILELRAIANEGYEFVKWWDGETKASRDYYLDENLEISATFRKDSQDTTGGLCVVEFDSEPAGGRIMVECEGEKVNPGDRLAAGSFLELRAIADEGYRFVEWWDGETKARRDYELEEDVEISALFQKETAVESMQSEFCRIWPNPTEGRFYVELGTAAGMEVLSANGMIVRPLMELPAGRHEIDLDGQASGVYFLRLISAQENRVFKILLQR